jgi:hypothetical protein
MGGKSIEDFGALLKASLTSTNKTTFGRDENFKGLSLQFTVRFPDGDTFNVMLVKVKDAPPPVDPVRQFHLDKGCCDGSDPSGCHRRKTAEAEAARLEARETKRRERAIEKDEYFGCEPSEGDQVFCPHNAGHSLLKMGERCGSCGFTG